MSFDLHHRIDHPISLIRSLTTAHMGKRGAVSDTFPLEFVSAFPASLAPPDDCSFLFFSPLLVPFLHFLPFFSFLAFTAFSRNDSNDCNFPVF
jgi:hypothetical protein